MAEAGNGSFCKQNADFARGKSSIQTAFLIDWMWEVKQMNMLEHLNAAIEYIEANLCAEFDLDTAPALPVCQPTAFFAFSVI